MPGWLTDADLAYMQSNRGASLTQTMTVLRNAGGDDGQGGEIDDWQPIASGVPFRATAGSRPVEITVAGRLVSVVPWFVNAPPGLEVKAQDRLQVGSRTFEVLGWADALNLGLATQIVAREVS